MSTAKSHPAHSKGAHPADAISLLTADHAKVKGLFKQFADLVDDEDSAEEKSALVAQICAELKAHTHIEEEIFYPAVREQIDDPDLMDEALVEHASAKELIAQLQAMTPEEDLYDAKVTVLAEQIQHHVQEEEGDMFPKARRAKLDTEALGARMLARKVQLLGVDDEPPADKGRVLQLGGSKAKASANRKSARSGE